MVSLCQLLKRDSCVLVPGVYDCVSAMLAERAGFKAIAISGYCVEASLIGQPDLGFTNLTDIAAVAGNIVDSVSIPLICDADTGYGGPNQVYRTVKKLAKAGVKAIHIEDQATPKKCGGTSGRSVIPTEEMVTKIRAALDARAGADLAIIARTDAREPLGLDEAITRLNAYLKAGADIAFAAEDYTADEFRRLGEAVEGPLAICAGAPGWSASFEMRETYAAWGINLVLYPFISLYPAVRAMQEIFQQMAAQDGVSEAMADRHMVSFAWFNEFIGVDTWAGREAAYGAESPRPNRPGA